MSSDRRKVRHCFGGFGGPDGTNHDDLNIRINTPPTDNLTTVSVAVQAKIIRSSIAYQRQRTNPIMQTCEDFTMYFHVTIQEDHRREFPTLDQFWHLKHTFIVVERHKHCNHPIHLELECTKFEHKLVESRVQKLACGTDVHRGVVQATD